jgi:sulfatase modifying factor 1
VQDPKYSWRNAGFTQGDDHPVVNVTWNDAIEFCKWLSEKERKEYRLPSEAEWEYACRAGTTTAYVGGDDPETLATYGNVADGTAKAKFPGLDSTISARDGYVFTAPVGEFRANAFGLHDMHGNVWEWCRDWYRKDYEELGVDDPVNLAAGSERVFRGGSWASYAVNCRSSLRSYQEPTVRSYYLGFRVVRAR